MASGLVLTYTTSGIFNFAHGGVAFATAYLYYQLHTGLGVPIAPALIISVFIFAPILGLLLDRILLRRLSKAPAYARIVGTIGLLVALPAVAQWLVVTVGNDILDLGLAGNRSQQFSEKVPGVGPFPANVLTHNPVLNTDQLAVFVDCIDHDRGEKFRAILAQKPALGFKLSVLAGRSKRAGRHSCFTILRQVEHTEVPAYDFPCLIALDPLGAGIPVRDDAVGIKHVNGVIDDPFHQQSEPALTIEQAALLSSDLNHANSCLTAHNPRT